MKLTVSKSKNATLYYVQKSYRTESGKSLNEDGGAPGEHRGD